MEWGKNSGMLARCEQFQAYTHLYLLLPQQLKDIV